MFGIDAIHGHSFYHGAVIFPTHIGMACSWNPEMMEKVTGTTAKEVALTGVHWTFSPVLCPGRNPGWGRIDET